MYNFVLIKHHAKRAGLHTDLRFEIPRTKSWASFVLHTIPKDIGKKVLTIRTNNHSKKNALFTGTIKKGYGAGTLKKIDGGKCDIIKYTDKHIVIEFKGTLLKGLYHFVNIGIIRKGTGNQKKYLFFKGKIEKK